MFGPVPAGGFIANVMCHGRSPRRENRDVGAAFALQFELRAFQAFTDLIVGDVDCAFGWNTGCVLERCDLFVAVGLKFLGGSRVMAVAIDNHEELSLSRRS